jgi:hypothetical protein
MERLGSGIQDGERPCLEIPILYSDFCILTSDFWILTSGFFFWILLLDSSSPYCTEIVAMLAALVTVPSADSICTEIPSPVGAF